MPRSFNQKLKILYVKKVLEEKSDRDHPMQVRDIIANLQAYGINAERKTIYDDIEALRLFGLNILNRRGKVSGYYLEERTFEFAELKFLTDMVQSSHFLPVRHAQKLIRKLEGLTSIHQAKKMQRQALAACETRMENGEVYVNIEVICNAISADRQISFSYYEWTVEKKLRQKKNGAFCRMSPWKLFWRDDSYYLLGLDENSGVVKHYQVDKMKDMQLEKEKRNGAAIFRDLELGKFSVDAFGMSGGRDVLLKMEFDNRLIGTVLDRFGTEVTIRKSDEEHFLFQAHVCVGKQFFGWLAGLGEGVRIIGPEKIRKEYTTFLKQALRNNEGRNEDKNNSKIQASGVSGKK